MSAVIWDVYSLPLRDACVDHIVTDLPFGKKIGSKERNMFLYPKALKEMARVCRPNGRAILLTHHKEAMKKALGKVREYWRFMETRRINMGGLNVAVYMLLRTDKPYVKWMGGADKTNISDTSAEEAVTKDSDKPSSGKTVEVQQITDATENMNISTVVTNAEEWNLELKKVVFITVILKIFYNCTGSSVDTSCQSIFLLCFIGTILSTFNTALSLFYSKPSQ